MYQCNKKSIILHFLKKKDLQDDNKKKTLSNHHGVS